MSNRGRHKKKKDNFKELMYRIKNASPNWTPQVQLYKDEKLKNTFYAMLGQCTEKDIRSWFNALKNVYNYDKLIIKDLTIII